MEYSAATAPFAFSYALITLPHFVMGAAFVVASIKRKQHFFAGFVGSLFVLMSVWAWFQNASLTLQCRAAAVSGQGTTLSGTVSSIHRKLNKSNQPSVSFMVDGQKVSTWIAGIKQDCGFVESLGRTYEPIEGQQVDLLLFQGSVVRLTVR
jgi:hypothetical protein